MVFTCLVLSVFSTIDEYEKEAGVLLFYMEMVVVVWFTGEFFFRYVNFMRHCNLAFLRCNEFFNFFFLPQVMVVRMSFKVSNSLRSAEVPSEALLHYR